VVLEERCDFYFPLAPLAKKEKKRKKEQPDNEGARRETKHKAGLPLLALPPVRREVYEVFFSARVPTSTSSPTPTPRPQEASGVWTQTAAQLKMVPAQGGDYDAPKLFAKHRPLVL
jgi:hypothetical protein